jgi:hypothetical protein
MIGFFHAFGMLFDELAELRHSAFVSLIWGDSS